MGKTYAVLDKRLTEFIASQDVFFVATAPTGTDGHVNVSPKGYRDTFAVLGPTTFGYLDLTGSGAETIAHLRQNSRITVMFCSFGAKPMILRIYGTGRPVLPGDPEWAQLSARFTRNDDPQADRSDQRAIIVIEADRIADSCGYAVPVMEPARERDVLTRWSGRKTPGQLDEYRAERNALSIDGLPAVDPRPAPPLNPQSIYPVQPPSPATQPTRSPGQRRLAPPSGQPPLAPGRPAGARPAARSRLPSWTGAGS